MIAYTHGFLRPLFNISNHAVMYIDFLAVAITFSGAATLFFYRMCIVLPTKHFLNYSNRKTYYACLLLIWAVFPEYAFVCYYSILWDSITDECMKVNIFLFLQSGAPLGPNTSEIL